MKTLKAHSNSWSSTVLTLRSPSTCLALVSCWQRARLLIEMMRRALPVFCKIFQVKPLEMQVYGWQWTDAVLLMWSIESLYWVNCARHESKYKGICCALLSCSGDELEKCTHCSQCCHWTSHPKESRRGGALHRMITWIMAYHVWSFLSESFARKACRFYRLVTEYLR